MDAVDFCSQTRLVIVAGKGGVGKTTVAAALARMAASHGLRSLIIEVEGKSGLAAVFEAGPLDYHDATLVAEGDGTAEVRARTLTPDEALIEYLEDHGLRRVSKRLASSGALDVAATAAPGIKDILVLGKVKQLERTGAADLLILDAPAAGHAVTFLTSARGLLDAVRVGPVRTQAQEVLDMLTDPERTRVVLVTLPEETPVNELVETADALEDRVGASLGPVVVNGVYPDVPGLDGDVGRDIDASEARSLRDAAEFRRRRHDLQAEQIARLADAIPLPQLQLPFVFRADLTRSDIDTLSGALDREVARL